MHEDDRPDDGAPARSDRPRRRRAQDVDISIGSDPGMRLLLPVGRSPWAIAAGYFGLISVLFVPAPLALVTGILAIRDIR